jgi:ABC-type multidrug transport system fused ATPase/permease subunit
MNKIFGFFKLTGLIKFFSILSFNEKKNIIILFFFMLLVSFLETLSVGILIPLINFIIEPNNNLIIINNDILSKFKNTNFLNILIIAIFLIYLIKYLFLIFYAYFSSSVLLNISAALKLKIFKHYLRKNFMYHLNNNSSLFIRNIQNEVDVMITVYVSPFLTFLLSFITILFISSFLLYYSFKSSILIIVIFSLIGILLNIIVRNPLKKIGELRQFLSFSILKNLRQSFALIKEIKMLKIKNFFEEKLAHDNLKMVQLGVKRSVFGAIPRLTFEFLFVFLVLISIYYANKQNIPLEKFISLLAIYAVAAFKIMPSLNNLTLSYQKVKFGSPTLSLITKLLKENSIYEKLLVNKKIEKIKFKDKIEIKNLSFSYLLDKKLIFKNVNLVIPKGATIGIVGENGSGKSTLVNLICGLLEPNTGEIIIDNKEVKRLKSLQNSIGYMPQQVCLIDEDIKSNIALGQKKENINNKKIEELLKIFDLDTDLNSNYIVGEDGKNISGGQKQKIALARALYFDPEILILDEATSAMDLYSEQKFIKTIANKNLNKSIIIISHRIKALENCDKIYKIEDNNIFEINKNFI